MNLSQTDIHSALWVRLKSHLENEREKLRKQNDGMLTPEKTAFIRGRIAQIKALLALETAPAQETDDGR